MPAFTGARLLDDVTLEDLVPYIDWTFFFATWELKGRFPAILQHPQYGAAARELYDHARTLLDRIVADRLLTPRGVYGFWPANTEGDDIVVRRTARVRFNMLRQQEEIPDGKPNLSLADFIAPRESGIVRLSRRLRGHGRHRRRTSWRRRSSATTTTTTRSW